MTLKRLFTLFSPFIIFSGMLFFQSCKDDNSEKEAEEARILEQYIQNQNISETPTASGLYYIETVAGTGISPVASDWVEMNFTISLLSTNKVVITTDSAKAKDNSIYNSNILYEPNRTPMRDITLKGLHEGLTKMKEGGKATLIFPSKLGYGGSKAGSIPAYSSLIVEVELVKVISDIVLYEKARMEQYLTSNGITDTPLASGLIYHELLPGTGNTPVTGQKVTFNFTGKLLSGKVFAAQNDGLNAIIIGYNQVTEGVEEGLKLMKEGGTATIVIPYNLAFGATGVYKYVNNQYYIAVWPYSTVVYDLEILDIEDL